MSETRQKAGSRKAEPPRRRWSEAQRRRIVAESYRSGESASAVARRHGVHTSVLFRWRRRYRTPADTGAGFVPVVIEAPEPASEAASGRMEIVLDDDVRVIVDATVHAPALARVPEPSRVQHARTQESGRISPMLGKKGRPQLPYPHPI